jgi:hypothetical protein
MKAVDRYNTATIASALVIRLALDDRIGDAACLTTVLAETEIVARVHDVQAGVSLAEQSNTAVLADALVHRLAADGNKGGMRRLTALLVSLKASVN